MQIWPHLANNLVFFDEIPKIQRLKEKDMVEKATKRDTWSSKVEEDVNSSTIHKKKYRFYKESFFAEA